MDAIERDLVRMRKRYEATRRERDEAIRKASKAGKSYRQIAALVELSYQRVSQIVRGTRL